ncbi:hypothetical protein PLANPX_1838 [Lacipirellula parvula]|uniref:Uncharacterized protein n=1 Tax=Lacipirellula parvula TaxID=2650471 RepID=A0A5K7XCW6_9BACT|nr:hypothetical protein PLANPX_1838 [Lacipirellula parvula]
MTAFVFHMNKDLTQRRKDAKKTASKLGCCISFAPLRLCVR